MVSVNLTQVLCSIHRVALVLTGHCDYPTSPLVTLVVVSIHAPLCLHHDRRATATLMPSLATTYVIRPRRQPTHPLCFVPLQPSSSVLPSSYSLTSLSVKSRRASHNIRKSPHTSVPDTNRMASGKQKRPKYGGKGKHTNKQTR